MTITMEVLRWQVKAERYMKCQLMIRACLFFAAGRSWQVTGLPLRADDPARRPPPAAARLNPVPVSPLRRASCLYPCRAAPAHPHRAPLPARPDRPCPLALGSTGLSSAGATLTTCILRALRSFLTSSRISAMMLTSGATVVPHKSVSTTEREKPFSTQ